MPTGLHAAVNVVQAFFGLKQDKYEYAIWEIVYPTEVTDAMQAHTEIIGISVQFLLLAFGIFLTEWFLRKRNKQAVNK